MIKYPNRSRVDRVSNIPGNPGYPRNLHEFFSTGNPRILLEFCQVSWKFHGDMAFVVTDIMQLLTGNHTTYEHKIYNNGYISSIR